MTASALATAALQASALAEMQTKLQSQNTVLTARLAAFIGERSAGWARVVQIEAESNQTKVCLYENEGEEVR